MSRRPQVAWLLALLVLLLAAGCAYYNTFYYAKKYYGKARRIEEGNRTERLSPEAVKYYDQAIEKAAKVIMEHGGGWRAGIDDALFLMGTCYYGKREYEVAVGKFSEILLNYPESDHVPDALFYTGLCYHRMRNFGTATQVFDNLLHEYPSSKRRDEIMMISAQGLETMGDNMGALRQYDRLVREFRKSRHLEEVWGRIGDIHFDAGRYDSALVAYRELGRSTRDDEVYAESQLNAGACLVRLGEISSALSIYERILPQDPERTELGARIWLAMAEANNRAGDHQQALEYLNLVIESFENRTPGVEALFQIGYTHEVYLHDYDEARSAYERAAAGRTRSVFKDQATRRMENLAYMMELESSTGEETDQDRRAEAALKVAEFTLFEGRDSLAALEQYTAVASAFPEADAAIRATYGRAWLLSRRAAQDTLALAREILTSLAREHPDLPQAEGAIRLLRELGESEETILALQDGILIVKREAARRDSVAQADSLVALQAVTDSLQRVATAADSLPEMGSPVAVVAADSLAGMKPGGMEAPLDSLPDTEPSRMEAPLDSLPDTESSGMEVVTDSLIAPEAVDIPLTIPVQLLPGDHDSLAGVADSLPPLDSEAQ